MQFAEIGSVVEHTGGRGQAARHERGAGRIAQRILAIGTLEAHAPRRQFVEVRRLHRRAVAAQLWPQVVAQNEEDVWSWPLAVCASLRLSGEGGAGEGAESGEEGDEMFHGRRRPMQEAGRFITVKLFYFRTTISQSSPASAGGRPKDAFPPPVMETTEPSKNLPPARGLNHFTVNFPFAPVRSRSVVPPLGR
jgi:hypothetical protein